MDVSLRELNNGSSAAVRRAQGGEKVVITDRGVPVAELVPYVDKNRPPSWIDVAAALARVGAIDSTRYRADLDAVIDPWLQETSG